MTERAEEARKQVRPIGVQIYVKGERLDALDALVEDEKATGKRYGAYKPSRNAIINEALELYLQQRGR